MVSIKYRLSFDWQSNVPTPNKFPESLVRLIDAMQEHFVMKKKFKQFHQYQQIEQSPLRVCHWTKNKK